MFRNGIDPDCYRSASSCNVGSSEELCFLESFALGFLESMWALSLRTFLSLLLVSSPLNVLGDCPGTPQCSGHGECHAHKCYCHNRTETHADQITLAYAYYGGDCSLKSCPKARSWTAQARATDWKHYVECSGAGLCNRDTGLCDCFPGFTGKACIRDMRRCYHTEKLGYCSNNGHCMSVFDYMNTIRRDTSYWRGDFLSTVNPRLAPNIGSNYERSWDTQNIYLCDCFAGFFGPKCDKKQCLGLSTADPLSDSSLNMGGSLLEGNLHGRECSGRGICNNKNGMCQCFDGFSGNMCQDIDFSYLDVNNPNSLGSNMAATSFHDRYLSSYDPTTWIDSSRERYN